MTAITETDTVVEFRGVGKRFGSMQALTGIDLSVRRGEVVVILGPSGSGKSTLCRCINRLEAIDEGHILDRRPRTAGGGRDLYKFRTEVGMVFQSFNLFSTKPSWKTSPSPTENSRPGQTGGGDTRTMLAMAASPTRHTAGRPSSPRPETARGHRPRMP